MNRLVEYTQILFTMEVSIKSLTGPIYPPAFNFIKIDNIFSFVIAFESKLSFTHSLSVIKFQFIQLKNGFNPLFRRLYDLYWKFWWNNRANRHALMSILFIIYMLRFTMVYFNGNASKINDLLFFKLKMNTLFCFFNFRFD